MLDNTRTLYSMNPLKAVRECLHMTQEDVASHLDLSPLTIKRAESGTLDPSDKLIRWYYARLQEAHPGWSPKDIVTLEINSASFNSVGGHLVTSPVGFKFSPNGIKEAFNNWKIEHRAAVGGVFRRAKVQFKLSWRPSTHPLTIWRVNTTGPKLYNFCNLLAIHPYIVERYERGTSYTFPPQLEDALLDTGMARSKVDELIAACRAYAEFHNEGTPIPKRFR